MNAAGAIPAERHMTRAKEMNRGRATFPLFIWDMIVTRSIGIV
jgi:hypothetical protein